VTRIAAFDLSLTRPAACVDGRLHVYETKKLRGHERLDAIRSWVDGFVWPEGSNMPAVDLVAIEGYSFGAKGRAFLSLAELGGIVRHGLWTRVIPYVEVPPSTVKTYATGKGNAGKDDVLAAAVRRGGDRFTGTSNDEADAFWVWALVMDLAGAPPIVLPQTHRRALDKLQLPPLGRAA
jgi:Holliday junction resolvasome RuvABC endonuclease subunit